MMTQSWFIELTYKNHYGQTISLKEYHSSHNMAYLRLEAFMSKMIVIKSSIKQVFNRGEIS